MKYAGIDLRTYGLTVKSSGGFTGMPPIITPQEQIIDYAIPFVSRLEPKALSLECVVSAVSRAALVTALDNIALVLNPQLGEQALYLDWPDYTRYYTAKLLNMGAWDIQGVIATCEMSFMCADPLAYSDTETHTVKNPGVDPYTFSETPGGSAIVRDALFVITAPDVGDVTLANTTTGDTLVFTSTGINVTVDCGEFTCSGASAFSGPFLRLLPGQANSITLTNAGTGGGQQIDLYYRNAYL